MTGTSLITLRNQLEANTEAGCVMEEGDLHNKRSSSISRLYGISKLVFINCYIVVDQWIILARVLDIPWTLLT